jgi:hypothetical protein
MKLARRVFTCVVVSVLSAVVFTFPLRLQILSAVAATGLIAHLGFRRSLSKKESFPAWGSIALSVSASVVVVLIVSVAALLLVQSYQLVSKKVEDPYAMHVTWISYAALAVVAWLLFNPRKKTA